jgi:hypothetical protein
MMLVIAPLRKLAIAIAIVPFVANAEAEPLYFLKRCYKDYVNAVAHSGKGSEKLCADVRRRCLSKEFQAKWDGIVSVDGTGSDGLLLAQDYMESWKTAVSVRRHNKKDRSAEVLLGNRSEEKCLFVKYAQEGKSLRITAVSECRE